MFLRPLLLSAIAMAASASAHPIKWSATGTVTTANATSYPGVTPGTAVTLNFSYESTALVNGLQEAALGSTTVYQAEFYGAIDLKVTVTIGAQKWESTVTETAKALPYTLYTRSYDGTMPVTEHSPDHFIVTASAADGAVFPSFPYQGSNSARSMQITFADTTSLCEFLTGQRIPDSSAVLSNLTSATGAIRAGFGENINFTLDLASIKVIEEKPTFPLTIAKTPTGIELKWFGKEGLLYLLYESGNLQDWDEVSVHTGSGEEIIVPLTPFAAHPNRRFYKVEEL